MEKSRNVRSCARTLSPVMWSINRGLLIVKHSLFEVLRVSFSKLSYVRNMVYGKGLLRCILSEVVFALFGEERHARWREASGYICMRDA